MEIEEKLKEILANYAHGSVDEIKSDSKLDEDLDIDSLDLIEIVIDIEDLFDISIEDDDIGGFVTVQDIKSHIEEIISGK